MDDEFDDISDDDLLMALVESEPPQFTAPVSQQSKTNPSQFSQPPRLPVNITISNSCHITTINPLPKALPRPSPPSSVPSPARARDLPLSISSDRASRSQHESASQQSRSHSLQTSQLVSSSGSVTTMCQPSTVQKLNQKRALPSSSNGREITMYHGVPQPGANGKMRQTTLYGGVGDAEDSYTASGRQYRGGPQEEATHHELDREALKTWQYPMNLGDIREYQFNIVHASLFHNTLVALPTGLGKTLIAAAVMLNYYRWTKSAKLVFVAPTRPLVSQQINACYEVAGIPKHDTSILMGNVRPAVRAEVWASRRVIFTTPQTLENDISRGYADPKSICLLVIDEAHRATGNHSAAKACRRIMNFNKSFRVLALTATPGSTVESVQDVMNNLGISKVEIRTEDSLDIRQYTHQRNIDTHVVDFSHELQTVRDLLSQALLPITQKLSGFNVHWGRDPMAISAFTINNNRTEWMRTAGRDANQGVKSTVMAIFSLLSTVAHPIKMLNYHGIIPFFQGIKELRDEVESKSTKSKYKIQLVKDRNFQIMMEKMESWMRDPDFVDHPKLAALKTEIVNHFFDCPDQANSKVIVFSEFRDSTEHITRILNRLPRVKAKAFVGQAASKRSGTDGMKQADQIKAVEEFKKGMFNVLVATSIGEEGLDIGQVDLIVCYDASASPIRMLQRMGRTGRKRSGRVVVLLTRGKEEEKYEKAKDSYLNMQHLIASGETFEYRHDISKRIIPPGIVPIVDKRIIDIPPENSQDANNNPDPNKRPVAKTRKKAPPKKFHMPDGVITGFMKASAVGSDGQLPAPMKRQATPKPQETDFIAPIPNFDDVTLTPAENATFKRIYKTFPSRSGATSHVIEEPGLDRFPQLQRSLRPTYKVSHGNRTKQAVSLFKTLGDSQDPDGRYKDYFDFEAKPNILELSVRALVNEDGSEIRPVLQSGPATPDPTVPQKRTFDDLDGFEDDDLDISNFDFEDHILPPPGKDIFHAYPEELGDDNQVIVNRIPGRAPLRRKPPPPVRHKPPTALYPSSPARLYNVVSDDDTDHSGNTRPAKKNKTAGSKAKSSAPRPKKNTKPKGKATGRSSARTEKPRGFGEAELGDECDRTSDMYYSGDSDDCGSDLEDFIDDRESSQLVMEIDDSHSECTVMDDFDDPFDMTDDDDKPKKKKKTTSNKSKAKSKTKASSKPSTSHAKPQRKRLVAAADLSQVLAPPSSVAGNGTACPVILSDDEDGEMPSLGHLLGPSKSQATNGGIPKSNIMAASNSTREKPIRKVVADSEEENYGFDDDDDDFDFLL